VGVHKSRACKGSAPGKAAHTQGQAGSWGTGSTAAKAAAGMQQLGCMSTAAKTAATVSVALRSQLTHPALCALLPHGLEVGLGHARLGFQRIHLLMHTPMQGCTRVRIWMGSPPTLALSMLRSPHVLQEQTRGPCSTS